MDEGKCTVCTWECDYTDHVKDKYKYVNKTRKVTQTNDDLKKNYEEESGEKTRVGHPEDRSREDQACGRVLSVFGEINGHGIKIYIHLLFHTSGLHD